MEFLTLLFNLTLTALVLHMSWFFWDKTRVKRIFVVEDSESDQMLLKINLNIENCIIEYFESSEGIIGEFWKRKPDAVIIDYNLAGRTKGDELLKFCDNNCIPALLVTGQEGDILGVDNSRVLVKSADKAYYTKLETWANEVIA